MLRTTRFAVVVVMVVTLMPLPSAQGARAPRVETVDYALGEEPLLGAHSNFGAVLIAIELPSGPENFLDLSIEDATGIPVAAEVAQDDPVAAVCGSTETPLKIRPNYPVYVTLFMGRCADGSPAALSTGTITAEFVARSPKSRVQVRSYSPYEGAVGVWNPEGVLLSEIAFPAGLGSRVNIEIEDQSGQPVSAWITQNDAPIGNFCGATGAPMKIDKRLPFMVRIFAGPCGEAGGVSTPTRGRIRVEYSR